MVAIGAGRFLGRGLGRGTQSHLRFLPERHTDFIFASLSEELGLLGAGILILVFVFLLWRLLRVALNSKDQFGTLISLGVFVMIFFQGFVNMAMNLGLVPVTGVTLPLVSYGGSSLLATMIGLGMVVNVGHQGKAKSGSLFTIN
jgi:rod shape determining protein RodA